MERTDGRTGRHNGTGALSMNAGRRINSVAFPHSAHFPLPQDIPSRGYQFTGGQRFFAGGENISEKHLKILLRNEWAKRNGYNQSEDHKQIGEC